MADEKYKCLWNNCSKEFKHVSSRSRHQKTCKKGDILKPKTSTECPNVWCKKSLSSLFNLKRHLLICKPKEKSNHICSEPGCNKSFNKLSRLYVINQVTRNKLLHVIFVLYLMYEKINS